MATSRRSRKRYRRLQAVEATANPSRAGGWGQGLPVSPADMLLVRRAIRENWPTPPDVCEAIIRDVHSVAMSAEKPRRLVSAVRVFIAMEADNQRRESAALRALHDHRGLAFSNPSKSSHAPN